MTDGDLVIGRLEDDRTVCGVSSADQIQRPIACMFLVDDTFNRDVTTELHSCLNQIKGLSPWLRERMMLRAFPLLEGPDKARAAL